MKENFLNSMMSEGGKISHKRWIAATIAAILGWGIAYSITKAATSSERYSILVATMVFLLVLMGVTTVPQILSLFRGTPLPKENAATPPEDDTNIGGGTVGNPKP